jgi:hypothetical protein
VTGRDWVVLVIALVLCAVGMVAVYEIVVRMAVGMLSLFLLTS